MDRRKRGCNSQTLGVWKNVVMTVTWLLGWLVGWVVGWLGGWVGGRELGGWVVGWLLGCLVAWLPGGRCRNLPPTSANQFLCLYAANTKNNRFHFLWRPRCHSVHHCFLARRKQCPELVEGGGQFPEKDKWRSQPSNSNRKTWDVERQKWKLSRI